MLGYLPPASETPFKWRFAGGTVMAHFKWYFVHLSPHQMKKKVVKVGPPLTKLSASPNGET